MPGMVRTRYLNLGFRIDGLLNAQEDGGRPWKKSVGPP